MLIALLTGWLADVCYITGEIQWVETRTIANLKATCPIAISAVGPVVTLTSRKWVVQIPVPEESGVQSFIYRWGQSSVHVGNHAVEVLYGPTGGV